jgi:hypothetical protein
MRSALDSRFPKGLAHFVCAGLLTVSLLQTVPANGADSVYDVANISVDTTAKDAVAARAQGMAEAEMRAIKIVFQRVLPAGAAEQLPPLTKEDVEGMVTGVSIRKEQSSTTRYIATLDVRFNEQAVKQYLYNQGIGFSEARASLISILPLMIVDGEVKGEGSWRQAWEALDLSNSITPATILRPRPNLDAEAIKAMLAGNKQGFEAMQGEYGYGPLIIAVGQVSDGKFETRLVGTDSVGAIDFGRSDDVEGSAKAVAREAANIAFGIIENRWKTTQSGGVLPSETGYEEGVPQDPNIPLDPSEQPQTSAEVPRNVVAEVEFSGLKNWQDIRSRLTQVAGIQALEINSLSARTASITFDYAGPLDQLQTVLTQNGFLLDERDGTFVLRSQ